MRRLFSLLSEFGRKGESPDPRPVEIPANAKRPESLAEMVARMVDNREFQRRMSEAGVETIDEASDFDIEGDDPEDRFTQAESMAMQLEVPDGASEYRERVEIGKRFGRRSNDERGRSGGRVQEDAERRAQYREMRESVREFDGEGAASGEAENAGRTRGSRSAEGAGRGSAGVASRLA